MKSLFRLKASSRKRSEPANGYKTRLFALIKPIAMISFLILTTLNLALKLTAISLLELLGTTDTFHEVALKNWRTECAGEDLFDCNFAELGAINIYRCQPHSSESIDCTIIGDVNGYTQFAND